MLGANIPNMGINSSLDIGNVLFSRTRKRVLGILFGNPERSYYGQEIIRLVGAGVGSVQRELKKLSAAGLVTVKMTGNQKHYQANPDLPIYQELCNIVLKTFDMGKVSILDHDSAGKIVKLISVDRKALGELVELYRIRRLSLFGSAARGELEPESDIDLLVEFEEENEMSLGGMVRLGDALSLLFGRKVDIATPGILNNPYRQQSILKDLKELYAA